MLSIFRKGIKRFQSIGKKNHEEFAAHFDCNIRSSGPSMLKNKLSHMQLGVGINIKIPEGNER